MTRVVFHIGYPKTGTTTLQLAFARLPALHYLGKNLRDAPTGATDPRIAPSRLLAQKLFAADTIRFEAALPDLRAILAAALADRRPVLLSDEAFTFAEYMPVGRAYGVPAITDHAVMAGRLKALWPEAEVLVVVREQADFLLAWYLQRAKQGARDGSPATFLAAARATIGTRSLLNALRYDEMYAAYSGAFGGTHVHVLPFEQVRADFGLVIRRAATLAGVPEGQALAAWDNAHNNDREALHPALRRLAIGLPGLRRHSPAPLVRLLRWLAPKAPRIARLTPADRAFLADFFAPSNARLAEFTGLDLAPLGYALPATAAPPADGREPATAPAAGAPP
jgi:hypothetical protein